MLAWTAVGLRIVEDKYMRILLGYVYVETKTKSAFRACQ